MREQVSAFLDGELEQPQVSSVMNALEGNEDLRQDWQLYHLIGDVMRGEGASALSISGRVSALLAEEEVLTMKVPVKHEVEPQVHQRIAANRAWYSLAASLAGIAFVGWAAFQSVAPSEENGSGSTVVAQQQAAPVGNVAPVAYESRVSDYWMAHRQLSGHMTDPQDQQVQFVSVDTTIEERQ